jgi:hypothetical protein
MADKKQSLVEEALLQMENLKEAVTENAKGILASTMKEEISQLVKESLKEEEVEIEESEKDETEEAVHKEIDEQEEVGDDTEDLEIDVDLDNLDLDDDSDDEEVELDLDDMGMDTDVEDDVEIDDLMLTDLPGDDLEVDSEEEILAPLDLTMATDDEIIQVFKKMGEEDGIIVQQTDSGVNIKDDTEDVEYEIKMESTESDESDEILYEIEFTEEETEEGYNEVEEGYNEEMDEASCGTHEGEEHEGETHEMREIMDKMKEMMEREDLDDDMKEMMKKVTEMMSTEEETVEVEEGYEKTEMDEVEEIEETEEVDEGEVEERSLAQGQRKGVNPDGSPKGGSKPGTGPVPNKLLYRKLQNEVKQLREKNQEYKQALGVFQEKLTEVAVFNSNLAYATRLFTEHTTTKQEKINILRRFDGVDTLKESKSLYKSVKKSLSDDSTLVKETIENKVEKTPTTGSATNLIENKTYENPQFMRMRDLMKKL